MANYPRSKSIARTAKAALNQDGKVRDKAAKDKKSGAITLDSFVNFSQNLGIGSDNPLTSGTYGFNPITRNRTLLEWVHRGSWLGGVAIDVVADDMTRAGVNIKSTMKPEEMTALDEDITSLGVWAAVNDVIKWARLYGGALGVILIDGQDPETPLRLQTIRKDQFRGILPLDRWMVEPSLSDLVTDLGPDLGLPKFYRVVAQAPALSGMKIHHTRCIRVEGIRMPYWQRLMENLWGISELERLYDRMVAFDSATTGAAQLVYKAYIRTYKIKDMREIVAAGGEVMAGLTSYVDMMRRFQSIEGITLLDSEDDFEGTVHNAFGGLSDALTQFGQQLSGALQIPLVRLFGQSPSGFSSGDADLRNYYDTIKQKQERSLRVPMTKVYRIAAASAGIVVPEGFRLEFNSLWQISDKEKSEIAGTTSSAISTAYDSGLITKSIAMKELKQSGSVTNIFTNISDDDIKDAEDDELIAPPSAAELNKPQPGSDLNEIQTGAAVHKEP